MEPLNRMDRAVTKSWRFKQTKKQKREEKQTKKKHELEQRGENMGANLKFNGASVCWVKCIEEEVGIGAGICRRGRNYQSTQWHTNNLHTTHIPSSYLHVERIGSIFAWTCPHSQPHWDTPGEIGEDTIYRCQKKVYFYILYIKIWFNGNHERWDINKIHCVNIIG